MDGTDTQKKSETRSGVPTNVYTANLTRSFSTGFKPFTPLNFDYQQTRTMDMRYAKWIDVVNSLNPGDLTNYTQKVGTSFKPKLVNWLTHNFQYTANYQYSDNPQMREKGIGKNASIATNIGINGNFDPGKFAKSFERKGKSGRGRQVRRPRSRNTDESKNQEKKENEGPNPLLKIFPFIGSTLERIDPISISINKGNTASNYGILGQPGLEYQLGLDTDPKVGVSEKVTTDRSALNDKYTMTLRSGIKITREVTVKLDYSFNKNRNESTNITGTKTQSVFVRKGEPKPFPNWNIQFRGFEKLPLIKKVVKSASVNHGFSGNKKLTWNDNEDNITQQTINKDFRPLIGMNLTFKNNLSTNFQYNSTYSLQESMSYGSGQTEQTSQTITLTAKYSKKGGMRIPLFGNKKLENNIDFSLSFDSSKNETRKNIGEGFQTMSKTSNWSLKPVVSYTFSRTVRGGMNFEFGQRSDSRIGKTTIKAFGINANISLSGG